MGIDLHGFNLLRYAKTKKLFGHTITIGRQALHFHVSESAVKEVVGNNSSYRNQPYCEALLTEYFGATVVESIDAADYEKVTHVHDMNQPLPKHLFGKYDTVIDGGCLEHIYNVTQAFDNCSRLCKINGQILHVLPANNFCGHGFWQFSPELFFSLYSKENGYSETEVFLADVTKTAKWYQVREPKDGKRINVTSSTELYALIRTVLTRMDFSHSNVQQSDYIYLWKQKASQEHKSPRVSSNTDDNEDITQGVKLAAKQKLKKVTLLYTILSRLYHFYLNSRSRREIRLHGTHPGLKLIDVKSYISNQPNN